MLAISWVKKGCPVAHYEAPLLIYPPMQLDLPAEDIDFVQNAGIRVDCKSSPSAKIYTVCW